MAPETYQSSSSLIHLLLPLQQQEAGGRWLQEQEDDISASSDSTLVMRTLRIYGSIYVVSIVLFTIFRRLFPRAFNVREWSTKHQCHLAKEIIYKNPISWFWQVFSISDQDLQDQCGMDALCFLRALRFGRKLAIVGCVQAIYLIPTYYYNNHLEYWTTTADDLDIFARISIDNVQSSSKRLSAPVVAAYVIYLYTMWLILQEYKWYTVHRHKFLAETTPRNYAVYVSGIPEAYRTSPKLHAYFSQCSKNDAVLEAHIVMDTPKLDKLVSRRNQLVAKLQHALEMEQQRGKPVTHYELTNGLRTGVDTKTIAQLRGQLNDLNRSVQRNINNVLGVSTERIRSEFNRQEESKNLDHLLAAIQQDVEHDLDTDETNTKLTNRSRFSVRMLANTINEKVLHHHNMMPNNHLSPKDPDQEQRRAKLGADIYSDDEMDSDNDDGDESTMYNHSSAYSNHTVTNLTTYHNYESDNDDLKTMGEGTVVQVIDDDGSLLQAVVDNDGALLAVLNPTVNNNNNEPNNNNVANGTSTNNINIDAMKSPIRVANTIRRHLLNGTYMVVGGVGTGLAAAGTGLVAAGTGLAKGGEQIIQAVGNQGFETLKLAQNVGQELGATVVNSAGAVVPIFLNRTDGTARDAGFVVFNSLYATQMALQMVHHPKPYVMSVTPAPDPADLFWRNVGLPHQAKRSGVLAAIAATSALCFFWSIPMGFVTTLTKVQSLRTKLPKLGDWLDENPWAEGFFSQLAPLILLFFNEVLLPYILKYFATWEGHISTVILEASLFNKLCCFMIIQTFFVSAISGTITDEISKIIERPNSFVQLLANSLAAQSNFFIQICLGTTFFMQSIEMLRVYPLTVALLRRCFGPNSSKREREQVWWLLHPLSEPPEFWHAETFAQLILFYMVFFVYSTIAPIVSFFLLACFILIEAGYRYQFIHNYPRSFDTGGQLWKHFVGFILAMMIIAQFTLVGLLALKKSQYASPGVMPILAVTALFIFFINNQHVTVAKHLPTRNCILKDSENSAEKEMNMDFVRGEYLQPSLQNKVETYGEALVFPRRNPDSRRRGEEV